MVTYTKGPWRECGHDRGGCICGLVWSESADMPVADAALDGDEELRSKRPPVAVRKANARLIAAAPELLEALVEAEEFVDRHSEDWYASGQDLLARVRAAIAKATGGSHA